MNKFTLTVFTVISLLSACGKKPGPAGIPVPPPSFPAVHVRPAVFLDAAAAGDGTTPGGAAEERWDLTILRIPEDSLEQHGLARLFAQPGETNEVLLNEFDRSPLSVLARGESNIVFDSRSLVFAGICDAVAVSNLLEHLKQAGGTEVLSMPQLLTSGTNEAQSQLVSNLTVFTGAMTNSSPRTPLVTNLWFGHNVTVQSLGSSSTGVVVRVAAREDRFRGYDRDEKDWMSQYTVGHRPMFGLTVLGARTALRTNEVLLLGSPTDFSVTRMVSRVPRLSKLPGIGRYFTKVQAETNFFRTILMVRVNPE